MIAIAVSWGCAAGGDTGGPTGTTPLPGGGNSVARLELSAASVRLGAIGATAQLQATARNSSGSVLSGVSVKWSSDDITIADIAGSGTTAVITARAPGHTSIRAQVDGISLEVDVRVLAVHSLSISPATTSLRAGTQTTLKAVLDAESGADPGIRWASDNPAVATVSAQGVATAVGQGTAVIRATAQADQRVSATAVLTVLPGRSVRIVNAPTLLRIGENAKLSAFVDLDAGQSTALNWSSSNPAVASVSNSGVVTALSAGNAVIRLSAVADVQLKDSVRLEVRAAQSVSVNPARFTLGAGEARQLTASVVLDPGVSTALKWRSDNPAVALVAQNGTVTGVARGSTTITAMAIADTTRQGTAIVDVEPVVRDVALQPSALSMTVGDSRQLTVSVTADEGASKKVLWKSSNSTIASVDQGGTVTAVAFGSAIITAFSESDTTRQATALVSVRNAPLVSVSPSSVTLLPGQNKTVVATVTADPGVSTAVTWRSSNTSVAAVSASGVISGVAPGEARIIVTMVADTARKAEVTVTVSSLVQSVTVLPSSATIGRGATLQLRPKVVTSEQNVSTAVTYKSSNPAVASVNYAGLVTGIGVGNATITVTSSADTTRKATSSISVSLQPPQMARSWTSSRISGALYEDIVSLDASHSRSVFAVNSLGNVYSFNGESWSISTSGSAFGTRFLSVSAISPTRVFAVGTDGVIAMYDGSSWTRQTSNTTSDLNSVHMEESGSGFAVGAGGIALRYDGSAWKVTASGTTANLSGVWSSGSTAYAVGTSGTILKFNGTSWTVQVSGTGESLFGIYGQSASDIVAVGAFGTVVRFDGSRWSSVTSGRFNGDGYSVVADSKSAGRYFIASDDGVYSLSGGVLSDLPTPYAPRMFAVSQSADGTLFAGGQRGMVMRSSGSLWETVNAAPDLIDVWTASSTSAWAVGEFGFIYHWNGSSWTRQPTPTTATLYTVWAASPTEAFAAGDQGTMLRWNGSAWASMNLPTSASVYGLWGSSADNVYGVTSSGQILRFNGSTWSIATTASSGLWSVFGSSASLIYASGADGAVRQYDGASWTSINTPSSATLAGIFTLDNGKVWAVGADADAARGVAYSRTGGSWTGMSTGTDKILTSIWGPNDSDIYAVGESGAIQRFDGTTWTAMSSGTNELLWAVSGSPDGLGGAFAVGYNSTLATGSSEAGASAIFRSGAISHRENSLNPLPTANRIKRPLPSGSERADRKRYVNRARASSR